MVISEENLSQELRLKNIDGTRNLIEKMFLLYINHLHNMQIMTDKNNHQIP